MAILDRGILGGGRNAVGTVVMTKWRGKDVIRARVTPANPQTAAQTTQRDLFAQLTRAGSSLMGAFIRPYWRQYEGSGRSATTAFNEFVRANVRVMRSDDVAGAPAGTFDPAQMLLTRGGLAPAEPLALDDDDVGGTDVTWDVAGGQADDAVAVVVASPDGAAVNVVTGLTRAAGQAALGVPFADRAKYTVHVVPYRPVAGGDPTLAFHGSIRYDPDAMADVVVTGAEKRAAFQTGGADAGPNPDDPGALV
ncbi:DUF6266 family protein [Rubrivirga sp. IMCC43871]|uniref:DUF6266 family protein n=1 Tax=Rubrivirga sp. IMCC43871 TaxID=3391575 RepID=UPI003990358C